MSEPCLCRLSLSIRMDTCRQLDQAYGYPSDLVVRNFQQKLKEIKRLNVYSALMKAIKLDDEIQSGDDMVRMIRRSIDISDAQGYTQITASGQRQTQRSTPTIRPSQTSGSHQRK